MNRDRIGRNLILVNGTLKCRIKRKGKFYERVCPYQGAHALIETKDGSRKVRPCVMKWLESFETAIAEERWQQIRATRQRGGTPSIAALVDAYDKECAERRTLTGTPAFTTVRNNKSDILLVARECGLSAADTIDRLTPAVIEKWVLARISKYPAGPQRDHATYVANRTLAHARSLFARKLLDRYAARGIEIPPCVRQWPRYTGVGEPVYADPPAELKRATISGGAALKSQPDVWALYFMILNFGCRPGDALRATWGNFKRIKGDGGERLYFVYTPHKTKRSSSREVIIPVAEETMAELTSVVARGADDETIVRAASENGKDAPLMRLNSWMRSIGWDDTRYSKAAYELRKLFTSAVRNTHGVQVASDFCGSSVQMVQRYYAATYIERMPTVNVAKIITG